jgi:hypothetical protein
LRTRVGHLCGGGQSLGRSHSDEGGGIPYIRSLPAERLVRERPAGLGISALGSLLVEEFRDHPVAVGCNAGGAGSVSTALAKTPWRSIAVTLPYLDSPENRAGGAIDIQLDLRIQTSAMGRRGLPAQQLSKTSFRHAYWTAAQLISHHTINGCNLQPGDLLGTGTQSGPSPEQAGSLLELTAGGKVPIQLGDGEVRTFFEDGDAVVMSGWCERTGARRIGFGQVWAEVLPACWPLSF